MVKVGDKIKYRDISGEVTKVMEDMVIVKLQDNKEYSLPYCAVTIDGDEVVAPSNMQGVMSALKPYVKNMNFLNDMAKMMGQIGVDELHIKSGTIQSFKSKESLDEKIARYKAEALIEAEKRAREEHDKESCQ
jgi:hypothetical protein